MNKKLLALAVAGIMAAPMAAQAEATIYGKMHLSVDSFDNDNSNVDEDSGLGVSSNSSRIGFKGAEDLGGGMKAIWQIESGVDIAGNGGTLGSRNSFVGLAGGFGTVIGGKHDTPYKSVGRKVDLFGDTVGDSRTVLNLSGQDARTQNTLAYITPSMNGFSAVLAYVTDYRSTAASTVESRLADVGIDDVDLGDTSDANDNNDWSAISAAVNYANGPLYVGVAHQQLSAEADTLAATVGGTAVTLDLDDSTATRVAASYEMGALKFTALWQQESNVGLVEDADRDAWGLGAAYKMGANTLKAQYYFSDEFADIDDSEYSKWALGIDHSMSKQTSVYAAYASVSNEDNMGVNVVAYDGHGDTGPAGSTEAGGDPSALSVGLIHKF